MAKNRNYEVGRGKPPKKYQFKKGKSGNPKGRPPKKPPAFPERLERELNKRIVVKEGGQQVRITKWDALIKSTVNSALRGKASARKDLLKIMMYLTMLDDHPCEEDDDDGFTGISAQVFDLIRQKGK